MLLSLSGKLAGEIFSAPALGGDGHLKVFDFTECAGKAETTNESVRLRLVMRLGMSVCVYYQRERLVPKLRTLFLILAEVFAFKLNCQVQQQSMTSGSVVFTLSFSTWEEIACACIAYFSFCFRLSYISINS